MKKQTQIIQILVMLIVLLTPMILMAQGPQENPYGAGGGEPSSAPIDGGLSLLVAAGVGYGAKKLKEKRNKALQPKGE
jgi:hypothetical protein